MASNAPTAPVNADDVSTLGQRWYVLIIMMLVYTISIADRYVLSTLLGPISEELKLSDSGAASLGIPLALFYVTMGIPLSWLCDRTNRTRLLAVSVAVWSFMTAITGYTRGYFDLLLARIGVGIGEAGGTPACNSIIADYFPAHRRSMAMTVLPSARQSVRGWGLISPAMFPHYMAGVQPFSFLVSQELYWR